MEERQGAPLAVKELITIVSVAICVLLHTTVPVGAFEWNTSLPAGGRLEACEGDNVTLPWAVRLADGERVASFDYHSKLSYKPSKNTGQDHSGDGVRIDVVTADSRFKFGPGHQLQITHVVVNDTGNYTLNVKVTRGKGKKLQQYSSKIHLLVKAGARAVENRLQSMEELRAVHVTSGPQPGWHLKLSCGTFLTLGDPPVTVTWLTPEGKTLPSTSYENGSFTVVLDNPVESGLYICQVDKQASALGCTERGPKPLNSGMIYVDRVEVRTLLMEARNRNRQKPTTDDEMKSTVKRLKNETVGLKSAVEALKNSDSNFSSIIERFNSENKDLKKENKKLGTTVEQLRNELMEAQTRALQKRTENLKGKVTQHAVSFYASAASHYVSVAKGDTNMFSDVITNEGKSYNVTTGRFTAPVNGTYTFTLDYLSQYGKELYIHLMLDGQALKQGVSDGRKGMWEKSSGTVAVHLAKGQQVWAEVMSTAGGNIRGSHYSGFSGFLIQAD